MIKKITKMVSLIIIFIFFIQMLFAKSIVIKNIPASIDDFIQVRDSIADTPEGGAAVMILALLIFTIDEDLGNKCLTVAISMDLLTEGNYYKGYQPRTGDINLIRSQLKKEPYTPRSYINGATPDNDYTIPETDFEFNFFITKYGGDIGSGLYKVFVECSGASARPVTLKINDKGLWKAYEWSSLIVGVQSPKVNDDL